MKPLRIFLAILLALSLFVSCSKDDTGNPDDPGTPTNEQWFLTKRARVNNSDHKSGVFWYYYYDSQNRISKEVFIEPNGNDSKEKSFFYNNDGSLDMVTISSDWYSTVDHQKYVYKNNQLSAYITYDDMNKYSDTLYLFYNADGSIKKTVDYELAVDEEMAGRDFIYIINTYLYTLDAKKRIVMIEGIWERLYPHTIRKDTLKFSYSDNNNLILRTSRYDKDEYQYDTKPNYTATIHYPKEYLFIKSLSFSPNSEELATNNITMHKHIKNDGTSYIDVWDYPEYATSGFPLVRTTPYSRLEFTYSTNQEQITDATKIKEIK